MIIILTKKICCVFGYLTKLFSFAVDERRREERAGRCRVSLFDRISLFSFSVPLLSHRLSTTRQEENGNQEENKLDPFEIIITLLVAQK